MNVDRVVEENRRLAKEVAELQSQVEAFESSRWWRLHPRVASRRWRSRLSEEPAAELQAAVSTHALPLDFDEADAELCRRVAPFTLTTPPRIYALARAVEYVVRRPVAGALVECGVWRGGSMMAVAMTLLRLGAPDRDLYLFDTFTGMTEPGEEDVKHSGQRAADLLADPQAGPELQAAADLETVRDALNATGYPAERIHLLPGPVEETLPGEAPDEIAVLRLDTDWYASTRHELLHLYPRLVRGGVLIVDDYGYWQGARKAVDEYLAERDSPLLLNRIDYSARIAVKA